MKEGTVTQFTRVKDAQDVGTVTTPAQNLLQ